ncbi:hypothetical protein N0V85_000832 [Neurospora sp. IMI 360204]|nr:hypothetical protein N0V85_000832 [Neurospora sp. IMI 360204]
MYETRQKQRSSVKRRKVRPAQVNITERQPEEQEGATWCHVLGEPSRPASRESNASSIWGPSISYLDGARQSRSSSRPTSQGIQARREVKVITPPTSKEQPQTASIEQMPSTIANDKISLLPDTNALEVDNSSEWEDMNATAHDATMIEIRNLISYSMSLDDIPLINPTRPLRYLGVIPDDISFHSVSSYESNTKYLSAIGWIESNDYLTPYKTSARYCDCSGRYRSSYDARTPPKRQRSLTQSSSSLSAGQSLPNINADFVGWEKHRRNSLVNHHTKTRIPNRLTYSRVIAVSEAQPQDSLSFLRQNNTSQSSIMSIPISRESLGRLFPPALFKQDQPEPGDEKKRGWRSKFKSWSSTRSIARSISVLGMINPGSGGIDWDHWMQVTDVKVDDFTLGWDQIIYSEPPCSRALILPQL